MKDLQSEGKDKGRESKTKETAKPTESTQETPPPAKKGLAVKQASKVEESEPENSEDDSPKKIAHAKKPPVDNKKNASQANLNKKRDKKLFSDEED